MSSDRSAQSTLIHHPLNEEVGKAYDINFAGRWDGDIVTKDGSVRLMPFIVRVFRVLPFILANSPIE